MEADGDDHRWDEYDPMKDHYRLQGFRDNENLSNDKRIACPHHDGISGTCWKRSSCPYHHDKFTGQKFRSLYPEIDLNYQTRISISTSIDLPEKPTFTKGAHVICQMTHVEDPSLFFVRRLEENVVGNCISNKMKTLVASAKVQNGFKDSSCTVNFDNFYYGIGDCPETVGAVSNEIYRAPSSFERTIDENVNYYLTELCRYRKYQSTSQNYVPHTELVAVRINHKWCRAVVRQKFMTEVGLEDGIPRSFKAQILETGNTVDVNPNDICRLTGKFTNVATSAFKCCMFGIRSAGNFWSPVAIDRFKSLVIGKKLMMVVKGTSDHGIKLFEKRPYFVNLFVVQEFDRDINVTEILCKEGYGMPLNFSHLTVKDPSD